MNRYGVRLGNGSYRYVETDDPTGGSGALIKQYGLRAVLVQGSGPNEGVIMALIGSGEVIDGINNCAPWMIEVLGQNGWVAVGRAFALRDTWVPVDHPTANPHRCGPASCVGCEYCCFGQA